MLKKIIITICEDCLNGIGEMCHNPGCALCRHKVDLPIPPEMYEVLEPDASQSGVEADAESWDDLEEQFSPYEWIPGGIDK